MAIVDGLAEAFLEAAPDALIGVDDAGQIVLANAQAELLLGFRREELRGRALDGLLGERRQAPELRPSSHRAARKGVERVAKRSDGGLVPVELSLACVMVGPRAFTIAVLRDLTDRRRLEEDLLFLSTHDALTGLANRGAFDEALNWLDGSGPHPVGVLMADLDDLKRVNDEHGHAAGDAVLRRVAAVLRAAFRAEDTVARIGGDEFAVLAAGHDAQATELLAQRLDEALLRHNHETFELPLSLSIGTAVAEAGTPVSVALQRADAAMYTMKRAHHGR